MSRPARGKARSSGATKTRSQSPRRSRRNDALNDQESFQEDHELELESLIQLNFEAASGELPSPRATENHDDEEPLVSSNTSSYGVIVQVPSSSCDSADKAVPALVSVVGQKLVRKPRDRRLPEKSAVKPLLTRKEGSYFSADGEIANISGGNSSIRHKVDPYDDSDAASAFIRGFQPFLARDDGLQSAAAYPLALPVPIQGVADHSSLKAFRDQMLDRHQECEVQPPDQEDLARFFLELRDGQGIHLQLPSLAFPVPPRDTRLDGQFVLVGNLILHESLGKAELVTVHNNRRLRFEVSQHNIPSIVTEKFVFHHSKNDTEPGTVTLQTVDLSASLSGSMNFVERSVDAIDLNIRRNSVLDKISVETKSVLERMTERKRKLDFSPADFVAGRTNTFSIPGPSALDLKQGKKRKVNVPRLDAVHAVTR